MAHVAQQRACWCSTCRRVLFGDMRMVLCPECGNKRCPRATDHSTACSGSNALGQPGSAYTVHLPPQRIINGAIMNQEEIESIAQRPTYCKTDGEAVTLSRAERDALVAMARDGLRWGHVLSHARWGYPSSEGSQYEDVYLVVTGTKYEDQEHALRILDAAMAKEQT